MCVRSLQLSARALIIFLGSHTRPHPSRALSSLSAGIVISSARLTLGFPFPARLSYTFPAHAETTCREEPARDFPTRVRLIILDTVDTRSLEHASVPWADPGPRFRGARRCLRRLRGGRPDRQSRDLRSLPLERRPGGLWRS